MERLGAALVNYDIIFFLQFLFTIFSSFLEIFDTATDVRSVKIYGESCQNCNEMDKSKLNPFIFPRMIFCEKNLAQVIEQPIRILNFP